MLKDPKKTTADIVNWIREYFKENGPTCSAVIGISGGKDSSVTAALLKEALGKDRVVGVLMPDGVQSDLDDALLLVKTLGIPYTICNIGEVTAAMKAMLSGNDELAKITGQSAPDAETGRWTIARDAVINMPPRIRMTTLYAVGQMLPNGGRVVNTCNLSEDYVGYSTKYGDAAGDFSPLAMFLVDEVLQIGAELGLPERLLYKAPSDGLSGMTDEDKLGFTYAALADYINTGVCEDEAVKANIDRRHRLNLHKLRLMPKYVPEGMERALGNDE